MANDDESNKGFKVVDRRITAEEEKPDEAGKSVDSDNSDDSAKSVKPVDSDKEEKSVKGPGWEMRGGKEPEPKALPPMDFTTFCLSLASSAMIHLGQAPSPETGKTDKSLPLAKQTIDILALLEEKTRGNLSAEEERLLSTLLYDLRMRFVQESRS